MEIILEMEDEYTRKSKFDRIYPTEDPELNAYYNQFFETQRYNNKLVNLWIQERGVCGLLRGASGSNKRGSSSGNRGGSRGGTRLHPPTRPHASRLQSSSRPNPNGSRNSMSSSSVQRPVRIFFFFFLIIKCY